VVGIVSSVSRGRQFKIKRILHPLGRDFNTEALEDHRILVKGYIIRQPEFERISVTSVTDVGEECG